MLNISPQLLRRISLLIIFAAIICMGMAAAQVNSSSSEPAMTAPTTGETKTMDNYLNNNPKVADELHNNPGLINDPKWLAAHPKVQNYLNNHPSLRSDAATHPAEFVNHTERHDLAVDHKGLNSTDAFMKNHPEMAQELKNNPKLIDDPKYLAKHPELDSYLAKHPEIRKDWQEHPREFTHAAEANAHYDHRARSAATPKK